jgi:hypothetical protein
MLSSYLPLIVTESYCFIFAFAILLRLNPTVGSEDEMRELKGVIYSYLVMVLTDVIWALNVCDIIRPEKYLYAACNAATLISVDVGCYYCFHFISRRLQLKNMEKKNIRRLTAIPVQFIFAINSISVFTGWTFYIDPDGQFAAARNSGCRVYLLLLIWWLLLYAYCTNVSSETSGRAGKNSFPTSCTWSRLWRLHSLKTIFLRSRLWHCICI